MHDSHDTKAPPASAVERLQTPADYQATRGTVFAARESLHWFIRRNRPALVDRHALFLVAGRKLIDPDQFDQAVLDIGARNAKALDGSL